MSMKTNSTRMEDVAALAGVSTITVSRALNRPEKVSAAARAKVMAAIKKTGFVANLAAGTLASKRSRIVGAIVPTLSNSIFAETMRGLSEGLAASGYQLLLGQSNYELSTEDQLVNTFLGRQVDGLVLTGGNHSLITRKRLRLSKLPVVETWDLPAKPIDMVAGFSNRAAGQSVGRYLLECGYRHIDFAGGPDDRSLARREGLRSIVEGKPSARLRVHALPRAGGFPAGAQLVARLHETGDLPQAIFFGNDALAAGALLECQRRAIAVPHELALIGFADLDIAAALDPALSTVRVPSKAMGDVAASLLLNRLGDLKCAPNALPELAALDRGRCDLGFSLLAREST
jgi:LacI family transcriptional regulator, gluconate utilization system Gnt-I transcriptional repressor